MGKTLIVSVGGSLSPIIYSIKHHQPENVIFFVSPESETQILEILRHNDLAEIKIRKIDKIVTESAEIINSCLKALLSELPKILTRWNTKIDEVIVDYTGGTKSMSSALVLGTIEYTKCFSYIGAKDEKGRNKDGIGVVIDGQERVLTLKNPWDELAVGEKKKISLLFNSGRYKDAWDAAQSPLEKVSENQRPLFSIIAQFSKIYYEWDSFNYDGAIHSFKKAIHELEILCSSLFNEHFLLAFWEKSKENLKFLYGLIYGSEEEPEKTKQPSEEEKKALELKKEEYRLLDLLANAKRRAELEKRYDDALIRIYRALEKRAQLELKKYDLNSSDIKLDLVPDKVRDEIKTKYYNERTQKIEVPLYAAYKLLMAFEEEKGANSIGHRFFEIYDSIIWPIVDMRNKNIIVHGNVRADENKFKSAFAKCLEFLELDEKALPEFPQLTF